MTIEAGAIVCLKSGGMAMTVISADDEIAECVWCGEDGDLFREKIPTVALMVAEEKDEDEKESDEEDESDEENEEDDEDDEDGDDHSSSSKKKKAA